MIPEMTTQKILRSVACGMIMSFEREWGCRQM